VSFGKIQGATAKYDSLYVSLTNTRKVSNAWINLADEIVPLNFELRRFDRLLWRPHRFIDPPNTTTSRPSENQPQ
jgi:hypothetical protein